MSLIDIAHESIGSRIPDTRIQNLGFSTDLAYTDLFYQYRLLRKIVYVDERQFLDEAAVAEDGGERINDDDKRSLHLGHFTAEDTCVGAMRFIRREGIRLPGEELFDIDVGSEAEEVSRFMAHHPDRRVQEEISNELTGLSLAVPHHRKARSLAVVERPFILMLRRKGMVIEELSAPRKLSEYGNTVNSLVELKQEASLERAFELDKKRKRTVGPTWQRMFDNAQYFAEAA